MKTNEKYLIFKQGSKYYKFLKYKVSFEGSFYIIFPQKVTGEVEVITTKENNLIIKNNINTNTITRKISCHVTGVVNYENFVIGKKTISVIEPLHSITSPHHILTYSIPSISRLDRYNDSLEECDILIVDERNNKRINFILSIVPMDNMSIIKHLYDLTINNQYRLVIDVSFEIVQGKYEHKFICTFPFETYRNTDLSKLFSKYHQEYSKIIYHQKINNTQKLIVYEPTDKGVYRIVFTVPMFRPPDINIKFTNPKLKIVILRDLHSKTSSAFKVVNLKKGEIPEILHIELNAEL